MPASQRDGYLQLFHNPELGPAQFSRLLKMFQRLPAVLQADRNTLSECGLASKEIAAIEQAAAGTTSGLNLEADLRWLDHPDHNLVCFEDDDYPALLKEISCPPPLLYVAGNPGVFALPQFAIVGSRKASHAGKQNAFWLARELSLAGLCINSGLARGIDSEAHQGALDGNGITVAVLGTGIDQIYPQENSKLAERILEYGALVSEFPLGSPPHRAHFPQRNRIISGMSVGLMVAEATLRSGSLITARTAIEQNREVFAVPGPISSPGSRGCHALIRNGAKLVESTEDILEELNSLVQLQLNCNAIRLPGSIKNIADCIKPGYRDLLEAVGHECCHPDVLQQRTKLTWSELQTALLDLELQGIIERENGYVRRLV